MERYRQERLRPRRDLRSFRPRSLSKVLSVDTSFLVGLAVREHPAHCACWKLFDTEILGGIATMAIPPSARLRHQGRERGDAVDT